MDVSYSAASVPTNPACGRCQQRHQTMAVSRGHGMLASAVSGAQLRPPPGVNGTCESNGLTKWGQLRWALLHSEIQKDSVSGTVHG